MIESPTAKGEVSTQSWPNFECPTCSCLASRVMRRRCPLTTAGEVAKAFLNVIVLPSARGVGV